MIRFRCPSCDAALNAPPAKAGAEAKCRKCGQAVRVPSPARLWIWIAASASLLLLACVYFLLPKSPKPVAEAKREEKPADPPKIVEKPRADRMVAVGPKVGAVLWPAPGMADVPLLFPGNEVPDPLPALKDKVAGYPITITFPAGIEVESSEAAMEDETGRSVSFHLSGPDKPANKDHAREQGNTICAIPKSPLDPGKRYLVRIGCKMKGEPWSRQWSFTTAKASTHDPLKESLARLNRFRKEAGVPETALDEALCRACRAHAEYLGRHYGRVTEVNGERPDLEGYTKEGDEVSKRAAVRVNAADDTAETGIDWLLANPMNRNLALNPSMATVGIGLARQGRGWAWVIAMPATRRRGDGPPFPYPGEGQEEAPTLGCPISLSFFPLDKVEDAEATLEADGEVIACKISTPAERLPGTGSYVQVVLFPMSPLKPATKHTATVKATVNGKPFQRSWSFTTEREQDTAAKLLADVNALRKTAGLGAVEMDDSLTRGCRLHALYLQKNLGHPKATGLSVHDEDEALPGYTAEGKRAAAASVIGVVPDPRQAVHQWMATLYHRIPFLDPGLKRIGFAEARDGTGEWIVVMDVSGR